MATSAKVAEKKTAKEAVKPAAKLVTKQVTKPAAKAVVKPAKKSTPSLSFSPPDDLWAKAEALLTALEQMPDHAKHGEAIADLVAELTETGMDYYYLKALKTAQVGFLGEQQAKLGMSVAVKAISSVSRKFILKMDANQLLVVAQHIRELSK